MRKHQRMNILVLLLVLLLKTTTNATVNNPKVYAKKTKQYKHFKNSDKMLMQMSTSRHRLHSLLRVSVISRDLPTKSKTKSSKIQPVKTLFGEINEGTLNYVFIILGATFFLTTIVLAIFLLKRRNFKENSDVPVEERQTLIQEDQSRSTVAFRETLQPERLALDQNRLDKSLKVRAKRMSDELKRYATNSSSSKVGTKSEELEQQRHALLKAAEMLSETAVTLERERESAFQSAKIAKVFEGEKRALLRIATETESNSKAEQEQVQVSHDLNLERNRISKLGASDAENLILLEKVEKVEKEKLHLIKSIEQSELILLSYEAERAKLLKVSEEERLRLLKEKEDMQITNKKIKETAEDDCVRLLKEREDDRIQLQKDAAAEHYRIQQQHEKEIQNYILSAEKKIADLIKDAEDDKMRLTTKYEEALSQQQKSTEELLARVKANDSLLDSPDSKDQIEILKAKFASQLIEQEKHSTMEIEKWRNRISQIQTSELEKKKTMETAKEEMEKLVQAAEREKVNLKQENEKLSKYADKTKKDKLDIQARHALAIEREKMAASALNVERMRVSELKKSDDEKMRLLKLAEEEKMLLIHTIQQTNSSSEAEKAKLVKSFEDVLKSAIEKERLKLEAEKEEMRRNHDILLAQKLETVKLEKENLKKEHEKLLAQERDNVAAANRKALIANEALKEIQKNQDIMEVAFEEAARQRELLAAEKAAEDAAISAHNEKEKIRAAFDELHAAELQKERNKISAKLSELHMTELEKERKLAAKAQREKITLLKIAEREQTLRLEMEKNLCEDISNNEELVLKGRMGKLTKSPRVILDNIKKDIMGEVQKGLLLEENYRQKELEAKVESEKIVRSVKKRPSFRGSLLKEMKVVTIVHAIIGKKARIDAIHISKSKARVSLAESTRNYFVQMYGSIARDRRLSQFRHSLIKHKSENTFLQWFGILIGWDDDRVFNIKTPFRGDAVHVFIDFIMNVLPLDRIEKCLDEAPCLLALNDVLRAIGVSQVVSKNIPPDQSWFLSDVKVLFDDEYRETESFKTLLTLLRGQSSYQLMKNQNKDSSLVLDDDERMGYAIKNNEAEELMCIEFKFAMNAVLTEWYRWKVPLKSKDGVKSGGSAPLMVL